MNKPVKKKPALWIKILRLTLTGLAAFVLIGYLAACYLLADYSTRSESKGKLGAYFPSWDGLDFQEVAFESKAQDKITIRGWFVPRPNSGKVLIKVHGSRGDRTNFLELNKPLWQSDYNLLMFDLRGHGLTDGERFSYGLYEQYDILAAVDWLKNKGFKPDKIGIIGWSMGASSALMGMGLATDIKAGVFDSAYGDLARVGQQQYSGLLYPFYWGINTTSRLLWDLDAEQVKPETAMSKLAGRKIMLIHGDRDTTVPVGEAYHLLEAGGGEKTVGDFWIVPGAVHVNAYFDQPKQYLQRVTRFFDKQLGG